ncbi:MAG: triacylglycerol lipase [Actinomycetota bacterium]|nr:triacylglycerol lipase [Actinomycetota bacterium]
MRRSRIAVLVGLLPALLISTSAVAHHSGATGHSCPLPPTEAQYHFAADFRPPYDAETQRKGFEEQCTDKAWRVAGFGGAPITPTTEAREIPSTCKPGRTPVILVHGNVADAGDWYPTLPVFAAAGYTMCDLWGLSYNGVGSNNGRALYTTNTVAEEERGDAGGSARITNNTLNVPDLREFIKAVLDYTGAKRFSIAGHSLGVTVIRKTLQLSPRLFRKVDTFVAIAGANHGTTLCDGNQPILAAGSDKRLVSCGEIAPPRPPAYINRWLDRLNGKDETPGKVRYMTVYDGSGAGDPAYADLEAQSPRLEGALNCQFPGAYHNDLRVDAAIAPVYVAFIAHKPLPEVVAGSSQATPQGGSCAR